VQLNPEQQAAVDHRGAPLLVLAGAGTGKTRVITHRVAALLAEGVPAWRILAVTFTNKAAAEMRERIHKLCADVPEVERLWVGTFHSIAARILRRYGTAVGLSRNFVIYDTDDQLRVMRRALKELNFDERQVAPRAVLNHLDRAKNRGLPISRLERLGIEEPALSFSKRGGQRYQQLVRAADAADFGDLLVLAVELLEQAGQGAPGAQLADLDPVLGLKRRFLHVVVDEYQDTNPVQARMVELLAERAELVVVGDDDQAIYGWRGADVSQILGYPEAHPGCRLIRLEQNYRSTGHILRCADAIIRRNAGRLGKSLWSELGDGARVQVRQLPDEHAEARFVVDQILDALNEDVPPHEIAVFYRTHAQSRVIEEALTGSAIRYAVYGGLSFFERREIRDLIAYLRLLTNPASDVDFERIVNVPPRKIGDTTVGGLKAHAAAHGLALLACLSELDKTGLPAAACRRLTGFAALMQQLAAAHAEGLPLGELASLVLTLTGYREMLAAEDTEEATERLENLQEFVGALAEFSAEYPDQTLADYLEQVSLASDSDRKTDQARSVRLMTIHSAKGLEFTRVMLTGMEEGVFPHMRSLQDPTQMEEERRLAYVAVTRAKRGLFVTWTARRTLYGQTSVGDASRFVRELPAESVNRGRTTTPAVRQEPTWNSDIVYDADVPPPPGEADRASSQPLRRRRPAQDDDDTPLFIGMAFRHAKFGPGELIAWDGVGADLKLHLRFADSATRVILARFCEPL
jgi:DNA helicase II / ATP-dependent DNA helicase PcrA